MVIVDGGLAPFAWQRSFVLAALGGSKVGPRPDVRVAVPIAKMHMDEEESLFLWCGFFDDSSNSVVTLGVLTVLYKGRCLIDVSGGRVRLVRCYTAHSCLSK